MLPVRHIGHTHRHCAVFAAGCKWAPELPVRLKQMHSHWQSFTKQAVVLRGISYNDRSTHFLMTIDSGFDHVIGHTRSIEQACCKMTCYCVPSSMQVC